MKKLIWLWVLWCGVAWAGDATEWQKVFADVRGVYLYDISVEDLAVGLLKGMPKVDKNLQLGNDDRRLSLYYKGKVVAVSRKPENINDEIEWAKICQKMIDKAIQKSKLAAQKDFDIGNILAKEMVKVLDEDSKFYSDYDSANGTEHRNIRTFAARMNDDGKLYIRVKVFNKQTAKEIKQALEEFADAKSLVVDLRGCPGGMAKEAVEAVDLFLDEGIIVSTMNKNREEVFYSAKQGDVFLGKPIEVLVDRETASAAEIFALALGEQSRAIVTGGSTKGKHTMQKLIGLPWGSVLAVSNLVYKTPSGE